MYLSNTDISYVFIETIPKSCVRDNIPVSDCSKELVTGVLAGIKEDNYGGVTTRFLLIHDMVKDVRFVFRFDWRRLRKWLRKKDLMCLALHYLLMHLMTT